VVRIVGPFNRIASRLAAAIVAAWLALASPAAAQNCVITGGTNYGTITQNCIVTGRIKLTFQLAIADELVHRLPPGKPIRALTVGNERDQNIAVDYLRYLQKAGFQITERNTTGAVLPVPEHPITIFDNGSFVNLLISPSSFTD
jgi:hypothetical protein